MVTFMVESYMKSAAKAARPTITTKQIDARTVYKWIAKMYLSLISVSNISITEYMII